MAIKLTCVCPKGGKMHYEVIIKFEEYIKSVDQARPIWISRAKRLPSGYPPICPTCKTPLQERWETW